MTSRIGCLRDDGRDRLARERRVGGSGGVRTPELRATWCRLEIWIDEECVTRVEEASTGSARRSIYVPLYPFAEWIAYNWWHLQASRRPSRVPVAQRTYAALVADPVERNWWLRNHNLRSAGEGFPWPDLTIVPEGELSRLSWVQSGSLDHGGLRYVTSGNALLDGGSVKNTLTDVVELALTRLTESGVIDTRLHEEWEAHQRLDADEVAFCEASARLGVDPFNTDEALASALVSADGALDGELFSDFLDAVDPLRLTEALAWVEEAAKSIHELAAPPHADVTELRRAVRSSVTAPPATDPWIRGYAQAQATRAHLGLDELQSFTVTDFVRDVVHPAPLRELDGMGTAQDGIRLALRRAVSPGPGRFASARALWHGLNDRPGSPFLLTRAQTVRQKAERAFAAELLAPAAGIERLVSDMGGLVDQDDLESIAQRFGVTPIVIEHQIDNQLHLNV